MENLIGRQNNPRFRESRYGTEGGCCPAGIAILAFVARKCVCTREATVQLATFIYTFHCLSVCLSLSLSLSP